MQRRRFLGLLVASMAPTPKAASILSPISLPSSEVALASASSAHLFKMLLNHLGFKALLEPDNAIGEFEYLLKTRQAADIESIIAQAFRPDEELVSTAIKLTQTRPTIAGMLDVLSGLKRDDPDYYASLFANIEPSNLALSFDQQFAKGQEGISNLIKGFEDRLKDTTRAEMDAIRQEYDFEEAKKPNFSDMAAARKAGGYPIPANYPKGARAKVAIGNHPTALGENRWIERLSQPTTKDADKELKR